MSLSERRQIDKNLRALVWETQFGNKFRVKCPCCEVREITLNNCHIAHRVALANGGSNSQKNLIPLCSQCNQSMGTMNYRDYKSKILGKDYKRTISEKELNSSTKKIVAKINAMKNVAKKTSRMKK